MEGGTTNAELRQRVEQLEAIADRAGKTPETGDVASILARMARLEADYATKHEASMAETEWRHTRLVGWRAMAWHGIGQWQDIDILACGMCQVRTKYGQGKARHGTTKVGSTKARHGRDKARHGRDKARHGTVGQG
ncbi:hypothetical protein RND71_035574 [Anisodus tanguticus]|uniref:Uncharacterized protein n=1 Tax=Anisodus tanguticus TaxID=243964 RepID=A0AAE1UUK7_9SOLA|nr:hypothetical protein RND71_035574 [Anisodus tanguticus]